MQVYLHFMLLLYSTQSIITKNVGMSFTFKGIIIVITVHVLH
jgi:hypothetical protein